MVMATKPNFFRALGVAYLLYQAWTYFKGQSKLLDQWDWALKGLRILSVGKQFMELELSIDLTNASNINATVTGIDFDVYLQNKNIGRALSNDVFTFAPYGTSNIKVRFRSSLGNLLAVVKNMMAVGVNIPVRIEGTMKAETLKGVFVPVPVNYSTTIKELIFD
jgi:LEA14-like dessication related protein